MAKPVTIGDRPFPSKNAAYEEIYRIRDSYPDGVPLSHEDDNFMRALLSLHTEAKQKIGVGVSHFSVATEAEFGGRNRHFVLHRLDKSFTDFSFRHCLSPGAKDRNDRIMALRQAIKEQTWAFRDKEFASGKHLICPFENVSLTLDTCQIDHESPLTFETLVLNWLSAAGISLADVSISPPTDNQLVAHMTDLAQRQAWRSFHKTYAKLRLLSVRGNLSGARTGNFSAQA